VEKTKFEKFISKHNLIAEIKIDSKGTSIILYKDTDLYLYSEYDISLNGAIEKAVNTFLKRNK